MASEYGTDTHVSGQSQNASIHDEQGVPAAVLCAGIVGNVRLHERLPANEAARAIERCLKRVERSIQAFGGFNVRIDADELCASFFSADEACQAALELQARVGDLPPVSGIVLAVRVGVASAGKDSSASSLEQTAARLAGGASGGQIVISSECYIELGDSPRKALCRALAQGGAGGYEMAVVPELGSISYEDPASTPPAAEFNAVSSSDADVNLRVEPSIRLKYRAREYCLNLRKGRLTLGRDASNDLVIIDRRASRHHAVIELRDGKAVLLDASTNGSYVTQQGKREFFVHRSECLLFGRGVICFAASAHDAVADCIEYEFLAASAK